MAHMGQGQRPSRELDGSVGGRGDRQHQGPHGASR